LANAQQEHPQLPELDKFQNIRHGHTKHFQGLYLPMEKRRLKVLWVGAEAFNRTATPTAGFSLSRMTPDNIFNSLYFFTQKFQMGFI
jgi:hypothetical protein